MSLQATTIIKLAFLLIVPFFSYSQQEYGDSTYIDSTYMYDSDNDEYFEDEYYEDEYYDEEYDTQKEYSQMGDVSFLTMFPINSGQRKFKHTPVGIDIAYSKQIIRVAPFYGLLGMTYSFYGNEVYSYFSPSQIEGYGDEWEETFKTHFLSLYTGGRYFSQRSYSIFNPYVQFDFRFRYLFGLINTRNIEYGAIVDTNSKGGNGSLGYGISLGSLIDINFENFFLNVALTYDGGGGMKYFNKKTDPGSVFFVTDYYEQLYMPTSFVCLKIGLIFN